MNRREALRNTGWMAGAGLLAPGILVTLQSCRNTPHSETWQPQVLTEEEVERLKLLSDTIVPATDTPSATDVRVHEFVDLLVADVLTEEEAASVRTGLKSLEEISRQQLNNAFDKLSSDRRYELVEKIDEEAFSSDTPESYTKSFLQDYRCLKGLILMAYFTSEEGVKQNLHYVVTPGRYDGCIDLPNDRVIMVGNHM